MGNHTGIAPQEAQRRLKMAAMVLLSCYGEYAGQLGVTELQQNIIHFVQSHVPSHFRQALSSWHRISVLRRCQD